MNEITVVNALIMSEDKFLVLKNNKGTYLLPGNTVETYDYSDELKKIVTVQTNLIVRVLKYLGQWHETSEQITRNKTYLCEIIAGKDRVTNKLDAGSEGEVEWVTFQEFLDRELSENDELNALIAKIQFEQGAQELGELD